MLNERPTYFQGGGPTGFMRGYQASWEAHRLYERLIGAHSLWEAHVLSERPTAFMKSLHVLWEAHRLYERPIGAYSFWETQVLSERPTTIMKGLHVLWEAYMLYDRPTCFLRGTQCAVPVVTASWWQGLASSLKAILHPFVGLYTLQIFSRLFVIVIISLQSFWIAACRDTFSFSFFKYSLCAFGAVSSI